MESKWCLKIITSYQSHLRYFPHRWGTLRKLPHHVKSHLPPRMIWIQLRPPISAVLKMIKCLKKWTDQSHLLWVECTSNMLWLHKKCERTLKNPKRCQVVSQQCSKYSCPKCRKKGKFYGMCGEWKTIFPNHRMIMGVEDRSIAMVERCWNETYHAVVGFF